MKTSWAGTENDDCLNGSCCCANKNNSLKLCQNRGMKLDKMRTLRFSGKCPGTLTAKTRQNSTLPPTSLLLGSLHFEEQALFAKPSKLPSFFTFFRLMIAAA
jgi:hypothetical protein